jgi:hypothetical protein
MKIWFGYGSEHSFNLVMIGHFADAMKARATADAIERLRRLAHEKFDAGELDLGDGPPRFPEELLAVLRELKIYSFAYSDPPQLLLDCDISVRDSDVVLKSDDIDVAPFLKVMLQNGAKVELYSAHDFSEEEKSPGARPA